MKGSLRLMVERGAHDRGRAMLYAYGRMVGVVGGAVPEDGEPRAEAMDALDGAVAVAPDGSLHNSILAMHVCG